MTRTYVRTYLYLPAMEPHNSARGTTMAMPLLLATWNLTRNGSLVILWLGLDALSPPHVFHRFRRGGWQWPWAAKRDLLDLVSPPRDKSLVSRAEIQPTRSRFLRGGRGKGIDGRRATNFNERSVRVIKIRISRVGEKSIAEHRRVTSEISLVTCRGRWLASLGHAR